MIPPLLEAFHHYREAGIEDQVDYQKFHLYSIITHSTAIEGSTITELENQLLFDEGITVAGKPMLEQLMNVDLKVDKSNIQALYNLSFDAHYHLVTIHPWVDGNGRMSRLLMNHLQFEFNLVPTRIPTHCKKEYIQALEETREQENIEIFRQYMSNLQTRIMLEDLSQYESSIEKSPVWTDLTNSLMNDLEKLSSNQQKIIQLVAANPYITQQQLSQQVGISPKNIRLNMARLKSLGLLRRIGPDKGGHWVVKVKKQ